MVWNLGLSEKNLLGRGIEVELSRSEDLDRQQTSLALQESTQGYGEVTISAIDPDERHETVGEIWQQWDATHPVGVRMGPCAGG